VSQLEQDMTVTWLNKMAESVAAVTCIC